MALKPWYNVVTPREDLRAGRPIDAAEFAVHLDQVRDGSAADVYGKPSQFFERTYLTQTLITLASETLRRLAGERTETNAVFNLMTQFGGGKTHALTLLYHLATHGSAADHWMGVSTLLAKAGIASVPHAATAVFVGTEFDTIKGRGGDDGSPKRVTPWGEIAFQLGGADTFALVAEHERQGIAPAGDVIRRMLPQDQPCLILMDELMNYVSRNRKNGLAGQLFTFVQNLSETARGLPHVVVAISTPASEMEMTAEDWADYNRFSKLLDRVGKAIMMSGEGETSEIIRRRLFEWDLDALGQHGRVQLPREAIQACNEYATWVIDHRVQLPGDFPVDTARETFAASYPFHPTVISVFERKWQAMPRFQRTRGVLRLLALWVARSYQAGFSGAHRDPLIDLGTAPLDDPLFRAAAFEQLGEARLEVPVTTDIVGRKDSHATRLDADALDTIRKARLHRKVATAIFFESNGGQSQNQATLPEIRVAVASPAIDIANIETVLEALVPPDGACYYLDTNRNRYWFSNKPNMTKLLADRKASVQPQRIDERVHAEIERTFGPIAGVERIFFPTSSGQIPNQPSLTFVIVSPELAPHEATTLDRLEQFTRECGASARTYKSALIYVLAGNPARLNEDARKVLAWEAIRDEQEELPLDDSQKRQIDSNLKNARSELRETVWASYNHLAMLGRDNTLQVTDLGLLHSSAASSPLQLIINRLKANDEILDAVGANFLQRNWPAFAEWSTRAVRDAFFASPRFPRLFNASVVRDTIASAVSNGYLAYVGKATNGDYQPFLYNQHLATTDVEISEDMYIVTHDTAEAYKQRKEQERQITTLNIEPKQATLHPNMQLAFSVRGADQHGNTISVTNVRWSASSGMIGDAGVFVSGVEPDLVTITAQAGNATAHAAVQIVPAATKGTKDGDGNEDKSPIIPPPAPTPQRLTWSGDVPPQRWMNFYTRILTKFVTSKGLRLNVRVDIAPDKGLTQQQIEEIKIGLRELGLHDDVQVD